MKIGSCSDFVMSVGEKFVLTSRWLAGVDYDENADRRRFANGQGTCFGADQTTYGLPDF